MSDNIVVFTVGALRLLCAGISLVSAFYLAWQGKDGWGWFLVVGLLLGCITAKGSS